MVYFEFGAQRRDVIVAYLIAGMWGLFLIEVVFPKLNKVIASKPTSATS
ncbi:MAG: hypothetical protein AB4038_03875 [Prochloraceae cyanobacterium]